ncbi:MAG: DUF748 domain-containing protein [Gammaproteobacteria bacterium]|nr:DUF748 domain-containing protein [Gammaproteobacteria bacterium]
MRILKYTTLLIILFFILLPYGLKYGAISYLEKQYSVAASIDNIRFNIFNGIVGIEGVHIYGDNGRDLHLGQLLVDIDLALLFERKIFIESLKLYSFKTQLIAASEYWNIGGIIVPIGLDDKDLEKNETESPDDNAGSSWQFGFDNLEIKNTGVVLDTRKIKSEVAVKALTISEASTWKPDFKSLFDVLLLVNDSPISLKGDFRPFAPSIDLNVLLEIPGLELAPLIAATKNDLPYSDLNARISSALQITYSDKTGGKHISASGELSVENIVLNDPVNEVTIREEKVSWGGNVEMLLPDNVENISIKSQSDILILPLALTSNINNILLTGFDRLAFKNIRLDGINSVQIENILMQELVLMQDRTSDSQPIPLSFDKINVVDVKRIDEVLSIDRVDISTMQANLILDSEARLVATSMFAEPTEESVIVVDADEDNIELKTNESSSLDESLKEPNETSVEVSDDKLSKELDQKLNKKSDKKSFSLQIRSLSLNQNSFVHFVDNSVTPVYEININKIDLKLKNIDMSNENALMAVNFKAGINDYGYLNIVGEVQPFTKFINANLDVKIDNLALVPLSSYSGKYADLFIKRGSASAEAKVNIKNDVLNIKNKFKLNKLKLEPGDSEVSKSWLADLPMPLDLTLDVLRDKHDVISLDIPVEGKVTDPNFHLQDIYNTAMAKALKFAAKYYITQAIQPLGLILTAGDLIGKATKPGFEPLIFENGSSELTSVNKAHLKKLAKLFVDRPVLNLTICAASVEADWAVAKQRLSPEELKQSKDESNALKIKEKTLLNLGRLRTQTVKRFIADVEGIKPTRLHECNSKIDQNENAKPRVELSL